MIGKMIKTIIKIITIIILIILIVAFCQKETVNDFMIDQW